VNGQKTPLLSLKLASTRECRANPFCVQGWRDWLAGFAILRRFLGADSDAIRVKISETSLPF